MSGRSDGKNWGGSGDQLVICSTVRCDDLAGSLTVQIKAIFLDDGGVMNDDSVRGPQFRELIGAFLSQRLGGDVQDWAAANSTILNRDMAALAKGELFSTEQSYSQSRHTYYVNWLRDMSEIVGVAAPEDDDECVDTARSTFEFAASNANTDIPGAIEAIRSLHDSGIRLFTASGSDSWLLSAYLVKMGVRELFENTYGPDLVDMWKGSSAYYKEIMRHAGVEPGEALFVDDSARSIAWITEAGASAVQISKDGADAASRVTVLGSLAELPKYLAGRGS
jgi:HAD superfamily hydrolase (TIGR01509 family)